MAGIKPDKEKLMWKFLMKSTPYMTNFDKDGVGYAALGSDGLWGERWRYPGEAWLDESRKIYTKEDAEVEDKFKGVVDKDINYNEFASSDKAGANRGNFAVIYHSRMATCDKTLENVHPFVRDNTALIHNGVIRNADQLKLITSTCDSESILNEYVEQDVTNDPDKIQDVAKVLQGYYGCAVLTTDKKGKNYLDIFREGAMIYMSYIEELGTAVYCTSNDIIKNTCKDLGFHYGHMFKLKENIMIRVDAETGLKVMSRKFTPWTWSGSKGGSSNMGEHRRTRNGWDSEDGNSYLSEADRREIMGLSSNDSSEKKKHCIDFSSARESGEHRGDKITRRTCDRLMQNYLKQR